MLKLHKNQYKYHKKKKTSNKRAEKIIKYENWFQIN